MNNWKIYAKKLLTTPNPYTGLPLAVDPALAFVNLVNENALIVFWNNERSSSAGKQIIRKQFSAHLKKLRERGQYPKGATENGLFIEFLNMLQQKAITEQMRFLREEIGLKSLITDLNAFCQFSLAGLRSSSCLDIVDNHQYWDHPEFPEKFWNPPFVFTNRSAISATAFWPREIMPTRIFGKPFTVTEYNYCSPNSYQAEEAPLLGGYAGLQDWDGLFRFAWAHDSSSLQPGAHPVHQFDIAANAMAQMAERIIYMLFVRGDVRAAESAIAFEFHPQIVRKLSGSTGAGAYPEMFSQLGLFCRIGTLSKENKYRTLQRVIFDHSNWPQQLPENIRSVLTQLDQCGKITSETGEIQLNRNLRTMRIITPKSEVLTGSTSQHGNVLCVESSSGFQTVALHTLDNQPFTRSNRLLLIQLSELKNTGQSFDDKTRRILRNWGSLPVLLKRVSADVSIKLPGTWKIYALNLDGTRAHTIPVRQKKFRISTDTLRNGCMAYELICE